MSQPKRSILSRQQSYIPMLHMYSVFMIKSVDRTWFRHDLDFNLLKLNHTRFTLPAGHFCYIIFIVSTVDLRSAHCAIRSRRGSSLQCRNIQRNACTYMQIIGNKIINYLHIVSFYFIIRNNFEYFNVSSTLCQVTPQ